MSRIGASSVRLRRLSCCGVIVHRRADRSDIVGPPRDHPDEARFVVRQPIDPLTLWFGVGVDMSQRTCNARGLRSVLGAEAIGFSDCGFAGQVTPAGLLNGLCAHNMVAGARLRLYRKLCWVAA
jgi:hypothetical protein